MNQMERLRLSQTFVSFFFFFFFRIRLQIISQYRQQKQSKKNQVLRDLCTNDPSFLPYHPGVAHVLHPQSFLNPVITPITPNNEHHLISFFSLVLPVSTLSSCSGTPSLLHRPSHRPPLPLSLGSFRRPLASSSDPRFIFEMAK